jgi:hypothetical protein
LDCNAILQSLCSRIAKARLEICIELFSIDADPSALISLGQYATQSFLL